MNDSHYDDSYFEDLIPPSCGTYVLRQESEAYRRNFAGENEVLSSENARFWKQNLEATET